MYNMIKDHEKTINELKRQKLTLGKQLYRAKAMIANLKVLNKMNLKLS